MTFPIDHTHDPSLGSWVAGADEHADFPVQNLPFAIGTTSEIAARAGSSPRPLVAIGDFVLDLEAVAATATSCPAPASAFSVTALNEIFAWPNADRLALRHWLSTLLSNESNRELFSRFLYPSASVRFHLPARIGDYTDFYVGIHHATNVGRQLRPENPLMPNYKHIPIGYHGRASSIRVSGVPVVRPRGQRKAPDQPPDFGASSKLDYELELGVWIGRGNEQGHPIPISEAGSHIAGYCLLNDWSARDIQAWEYQPLGPFLGKSFHTTISPWVVTAEALAPFHCPQPRRPEGDPTPLPYLWSLADQSSGSLAVELEVYLRTAAMAKINEAPHLLSRTAASNMYWTVAQMITHHTSNGCNLRPGDFLGTGTISGTMSGSMGSMIEITSGGKTPLVLLNGEKRGFLEDGDEVLMLARARTAERRDIGFGACVATILPVQS